MGRRGALAALVLSLGVFGGGAAAPAGMPPREARWIDPPFRTQALARAPRECLAVPRDPHARKKIAVGRALFRSPLLLGGQAARAGLSCASCHVNGRGNPHFAFPGISGAPGTADITASLFSSHRGDGVHNPVRIPDLAADKPKVSRAPNDPALAQFIRGLIVEEFDGREPPPHALDGLAGYVRAIGPTGCALTATDPRSAAREFAEADQAVALAQERLTANDPATARLLIAAARAALGRADERIVGRTAPRRILAQLDAELRDAQAALANGSAPARLRAWRAGYTRARPALIRGFAR